MDSYLRQNGASIIADIVKNLGLKLSKGSLLFAPVDEVFVKLLKVLDLTKEQFIELPTVKDILMTHVIVDPKEDVSLSGLPLEYEFSAGTKKPYVKIVEEGAKEVKVRKANDVGNATIAIITGILISGRQGLLLDADQFRLFRNQPKRLRPFAEKYGGKSADDILDHIAQYTSGPDEHRPHSPRSGDLAEAMSNTPQQKNFDVKRYLGKWYDVARYLLPFDRGTAWQTAEYSLLKRGVVEVHNTAYEKDGSVRGEITGKAEIVDERYPAQLRVSFPTGFSGPANIPNYIVHETDYDSYAIVGSLDKRSLYILAREKPISQELYDMLLDKVEGYGYDVSKLVMDYKAIE